MATPIFSQADAAKVDLRLAVSDDVVGDYPLHIKCREHNDQKRGNLAVYSDHLHCFGCGFHEARTMLALAYLLKVELGEAILVAPRYTLASLDGYREKTALENKRDPLPDSLASIYHQVLYTYRTARLPWLYARGLTDATIARFQLGHDGQRFVIPVFDSEHRLIALRYRRDDYYSGETGAKYLGLKGRNGRYLFSEPLLIESEPSRVVVVEGELDCIRLWQEGIPAVTVTNGAGQLHTIPGLLAKDFPFIHTLILAGDQDEAGREATAQTLLAAEALVVYTTKRLTWETGKDITEAFQLGALTREEIEEL